MAEDATIVSPGAAAPDPGPPPRLVALAWMLAAAAGGVDAIG